MALVIFWGQIAMKTQLRKNAQTNYLLKLQNLVGSELKIRINNNRSTMLHVRWHEDKTQVSLHQMFLQAPHKVQKALANYIRSDSAVLEPLVKAYIDKNVPTLDHSHLIDPKQITTRGSSYNLKSLYNKINRRYFGGSLDLQITWFGDSNSRFSTKCTLGLYYDVVKLVKIHRLLDNPSVPSYVIEYVIYHEMVHAVCPPVVYESGRNCIHTKEFKELESVFEQYEEARDWLIKNQKNFFASKEDNSNGRTQQMGKHKAPKKQSGCRKRQNIYTYL